MKTAAPAVSLHRGPGTGHGGPSGHLRGPVEKPKDTKETLIRLWKYLKAEKTGLVLAVSTVLATTILNILGPTLIGIAIDKGIMSGIDYHVLRTTVLALAGIYLAVTILSLIQEWIMIGVSQRAIRQLRTDIFHRFQLLSVGFFDSRHLGELMSRVTNDIENISNTLSSGFLELISGSLSIIAVTIVMLLLNWPLALVCLMVIPVVILITKTIAGKSRSGFRLQQKHLGSLNGLIEESISGQRVVKAFTKEKELTARFAANNKELQYSSRKAQIYAGFMGPIMNMMNNLNYGVTAFAGGLLSMFDLVSVGTIAAFLSYTRQFARPLNQIAQVYSSIQSAIAGAERVFEILDEPSEFTGAETTALSTCRGDVDFKNLHFRYVPDVPVLQGIDIHCTQGQTIALVGPTGAGKTTIVNLLTRFYEYHQGTITIDGIDIRSIDRSSLRKTLGIVLQDTFLFSDTVKENIRYGRLDATDEEIIHAAKIANAHQFIHRMPKGYDTHVSESGANLSQGQRQLLAITRAVLSDPSILILDEATSSVDTRTELHIQEAMLKLMEGRTSFVIAHRLSTIKTADQILVMNQGRIVERGTHHELLGKGGFYHSLYKSQFTL
ncbi:MAG: ABC transporter ATP-binding protein [Spirochaetales bacterium]|nr:ABC transporter ATP-binding protein [Spirochaetales bacterium]